jgi:hypothetical protein
MTPELYRAFLIRRAAFLGVVFVALIMGAAYFAGLAIQHLSLPNSAQGDTK